jgi:hypothetical protein
MNFRGRKCINIEIVSHLMNEKNQNNFHKIFIYILEFLAIFSEFFRIFPARKPIFWIFLELIYYFGHFLDLWEFFRYFLGFFRYFSEPFSI